MVDSVFPQMVNNIVFVFVNVLFNYVFIWGLPAFLGNGMSKRFNRPNIFWRWLEWTRFYRKPNCNFSFALASIDLFHQLRHLHWTVH